MLRTFCSVLETFLVRFFLSFPLLFSCDDCDDDRRFFLVLFFDRVIVEGDVSRPNHHAVARDLDGRERWTGASLHEESVSRGDETMKTEDRVFDK
jgi:hypothetical protein